MPLHIQIITPERTLLDTEADEIIVPTTTGELSILPNHVNLVTQVASGILVIKAKGKEESIAVDGGFIEVTEKSVTVLSDYAVHAREVSAIQAEEAKKRAEKAMKEKKSLEDFATAEAVFRRAILELKIAGKIRTAK